MNVLKFFPRTVASRTAIAMAALLVAGGAAAGESGPSWQFSGYGSLGVVHANTDQADFVSSILKTHGAGYTDRWSPNVDSRLGAQVRVELDSKWSAVLQVITEQGLDRTYRPRVEWANVKYQVTPNLSVRVGRIALPMYMAADYRKVGYAYTFVRLPAELYNRIPITHSDGVDASYRWQTGSLKHVAQVSYGRNETPLLGDLTLHVKGLGGLAYTVETGALSVRFSALTARVSTDIGDDLFKAYRQFGPVGKAIADQYEPINKRVTALSLNASYDPGSWYVMGEVGHANGHSILVETRAAYVSAGYRHGDWTPYGIIAWSRAVKPLVVEGVPTRGLPPRAAAGAAMLNGALNNYLGTVAEQNSLAAGVRWDFMPNVALKLQYEQLRPRVGSRGTMINDQPGFRDGRRVNVASAVFDFVF